MPEPLTRWFWGAVSRCCRRVAMGLEIFEGSLSTVSRRVQDLQWRASDRVAQMDPNYDPEIPF
jgi:hypothetical protein